MTSLLRWRLRHRCLVVILGALLASVTNSPIAHAQRGAHGRLSAPGVSQEASAPPRVVTVLPFTLWHGYIFVQAAVEGHHGTFILDTGTPGIALNRRYLHLADSVGSTTHGMCQLDTLRPGDSPNAEETWLTVHTIQLGALTLPLDSNAAGPPSPWPFNAILCRCGWLTMDPNPTRPPVLGNLGLNVMEPFETIIDYAHQQLILIRLDAAGQRLAAVPSYTPAERIPLFPTRDPGADTTARWWGAVVRLGGILDTATLDTGSPLDNIGSTLIGQIGQHMQEDPKPGARTDAMLLDTVVLASHTFTTVSSEMEPRVGDILGYEVLRRLGVFGLNYRTRELILYHPHPATP